MPERDRYRHLIEFVDWAAEVQEELRSRRRNVHCSNCGDTQGGPIGHETSECTFASGSAPTGEGSTT